MKTLREKLGAVNGLITKQGKIEGRKLTEAIDAQKLFVYNPNKEYYNKYSGNKVLNDEQMEDSE